MVQFRQQYSQIYFFTDLWRGCFNVLLVEGAGNFPDDFAQPWILSKNW